MVFEVADRETRPTWTFRDSGGRYVVERVFAQTYGYAIIGAAFLATRTEIPESFDGPERRGLRGCL